MRHTLSCLVRNQPGVLAKVAAAFAERNINIHSLAVNESEGESVSRLTLVIEGKKDQLEAIADETARLDEVVELEDLDRSGFLDRELVLVKVDSRPDELPRLMQTVEVMGANVAAMDLHTMTL